MSAYPLFDSYHTADLPNFVDKFSDTDSLYVNDGYSDTEEGDAHEGPRTGEQEASWSMPHTRNEDDYTQEISTPGAARLEAYEGLSCHDFDLTHIERFLSQSLSDPDTCSDFPDFPLHDESRLEHLENYLGLKRKREETLEKLRSIRTKMEYDEMVFAQTMLGIDGDESTIPMYDAEHRQHYLDERETYYGDLYTDPNRVLGIVGVNDAPLTTAEAALRTQDGENKTIDKGKGKAVDKGKGKARDKGKSKARVSPYGFISSRTHHEADGQIPRLEMGGPGRADWLSSILHRPMPFDYLYEGRTELTHYNSHPFTDPHGYGGLPIAGGSGYNGMPIASGSGTRRDD